MRLTCKRKEPCDCSYCVACDASSHSLSEQLKHIMMLRTVAYPGGGGVQGAGAPPKPQRYRKELLRYPSLYQQLLPQTTIWRQKC